MLFNSLSFLIFFPVVTVLYFLVPHRYRWALLLAASCFFYMSFIPVYIVVLFALIAVDYTAARCIERVAGKKRTVWLAASISVTVAILFVFKYFNFFNANLAAAARFIDWNYPLKTLRLVLPIGLSFHTFQSLGYVIEVYRGKQKAEKHFGIYALYVMFFPQLVAGPIERAGNLLHQFYETHAPDYRRVTDGLKLMAWGMFKKIVIADRLAVLVNQVYGRPQEFGGATLAVATAAFAFQIFCDFSGYSDIAVGAAQVLGFRLMENFRRPYAARSIPEFWRRWHISLSSWFRDYLYIPLGGSRVSPLRWHANILITFIISGAWHGANWTFLAWGALNGFFMLFSRWTVSLRAAAVRALGIDGMPRLHAGLQVLATFFLTCFAWIFFRADSLGDALSIVRSIGAAFLNGMQGRFARIDLPGVTANDMLIGAAAIAVMEAVHLFQQKGSVREWLHRKPLPIRWSVYYALLLCILFFGVLNKTRFIYFQF